MVNVAEKFTDSVYLGLIKRWHKCHFGTLAPKKHFQVKVEKYEKKLDFLEYYKWP